MASINKRTVRWTTGDDEERTSVRYEATCHDRNGKRHRRMFDLKRDAQRWLDEQAAGPVTGQWADPRAGKETLQAYAEGWRTRQVHAPNTQDAFEWILRVHVYPHIGGMRLDAVASADVQELVRRRSETAAPTTVAPGRPDRRRVFDQKAPAHARSQVGHRHLGHLQPPHGIEDDLSKAVMYAALRHRSRRSSENHCHSNATVARRRLLIAGQRPKCG